MDVPLMRTIDRVLEAKRASELELLNRASRSTGKSSTSITETAEYGAFGVISGDEFLQILLIQLQNQDPLNTLSTDEFTSQLVQFSTLDSILQQSLKVDKLLSEVLRMEAVGLLGKTVVVGDVTGVVSKITFENGIPKIWINGQAYDISLVSEVIS